MNESNNKFNFIIASLILICFTLLILSEIFLFRKIEDIQKNQYAIKSLENKNLIASLIKNKQNATQTLAIAISQFEIIKDSLQNKTYENINLNTFSELLKSHSDYKNVWVQVLDKNGISRYRSWTNTKNDSVLNIRKDLDLILQHPKIQSTISVGKYDMTFKSMVPIFVNNEFIGVVELITHFNSITKHLQAEGINPVILVNKKYKNQIIKPFTNLFIDDYYVANIDIPEEIIQYINKHNVETFWNQDNYIITDSYYVSFYKEFDLNGDTMATFVLFQEIDKIKSAQIDSFKNLSQLIILSIFAISIIIVLFSYFYLKRKEETKTNQILHEYNQELEEKIKSEIQSNRKKDMLLANQSKLVALGEMLGNIAHQWRQPLSAISTATSGLQLKYEYDMLSKEEFIELTSGIVNNTKYLSDTIEDFRDFFKKNKEKDTFNIAMVIKSTYNIIKALYNINNIHIIYELDESIIYKGYKTELSQVFLNIFNNAKDALLHNRIKHKIVFIKLYTQNESIIIEFHDNAGGVSEEINNKIFDPYFTTKHQTQGTGIGLFMSNEIIAKHFNGKIYNENRTFEISGENFFGATFIIELPKTNT